MAPGVALNRVLGPSRASLHPTHVTEGDARPLNASDMLTFESRRPAQPHELQVRFLYLLPNQQDLPDKGFCSGRQKSQQNTDEANLPATITAFFCLVFFPDYPARAHSKAHEGNMKPNPPAYLCCNFNVLLKLLLGCVPV